MDGCGPNREHPCVPTPSDSYLVLYTARDDGGKESQVIYIWQGNASSTDEKGASALLAVELDDSLGGKPVQVRVVQGKEPAHFRRIFQGRLVVHSGGVRSGFRRLSGSGGVGAGAGVDASLDDSKAIWCVIDFGRGGYVCVDGEGREPCCGLSVVERPLSSHPTPLFLHTNETGPRSSR